MQRELTAQERAVHAVLETKLKLERVVGVEGAHLVRRSERFAISNPVVYRVPDTDTVFVFSSTGYGYDIHALREQITKLKKMLDEQASTVESAAPNSGAGPEDQGQLAEAAPSEDDIALLMSQAGVSREKAERALSECSYDIIKALSKLIV